MAANKLLLALAGATLLAGAAPCAQSDAERARQILLKTLDRVFSQNVLAIISQKSPDSNVMQRIQVQISRDGKMRQTVIYPLSMEGVETIDDNVQSATFLPDEKLMLIQESPKKLPDDSLTRINLTVRNYGLKVVGSMTVAGQPATVVLATPRNRDLETRKYYVDERSGFLLQLDTIDGDGQSHTAFKAQTVLYPARFNPSTFVIDTETREGTKIVYRRRTNLNDTTKSSAALGFEPVLPESIPYGFELQDAQINDAENWKSVAVRITDGLVKGTVYQWPASSKVKIKTMVGTTIGDGNGIRFAVTADVPESVRKRILRAFLDAAREFGDRASSTGLTDASELSVNNASLTETTELIFGMPWAESTSLLPSL